MSGVIGREVDHLYTSGLHKVRISVRKKMVRRRTMLKTAWDVAEEDHWEVEYKMWLGSRTAVLRDRMDDQLTVPKPNNIFLSFFVSLSRQRHWKSSIAFRGRLQGWIKMWANDARLDRKKHNMRQLNHLLQIPVLKDNTLLEKPYWEKKKTCPSSWNSNGCK